MKARDREAVDGIIEGRRIKRVGASLFHLILWGMTRLTQSIN